MSARACLAVLCLGLAAGVEAVIDRTDNCASSPPSQQDHSLLQARSALAVKALHATDGAHLYEEDMPLEKTAARVKYEGHQTALDVTLQLDAECTSIGSWTDAKCVSKCGEEEKAANKCHQKCNKNCASACSCYVAPTPSPTLSNYMSLTPEEVEEGLARKMGMNVNSGVNQHVLDQFTDVSSWFWAYSLEPENEEAEEWAASTGKEFVGLINLKGPLPDSMDQCYFHDGTCSASMLAQAMNNTKQRLMEKNIKFEYVMGYNEPYASSTKESYHGRKGLKSVNGSQGAEWWRLYIQPAAVSAGLKLVSPTTGIVAGKQEWMVDFLSACYDNRASNPPCTVELIQKFSVHEYKCYARFWQKYATNASDGGSSVVIDDDTCGSFKPKAEVNWYSAMKDAMVNLYPDDSAFWLNYLSQVKLWVTETSCSGDYEWDRIIKWDNDTDTNSAAGPTANDSCSFITGQDCKHKEGSIAAMLGLDSVERFSWFTLYPSFNPNHPNHKSKVSGGMIDSSTDETLPAGRGILNLLDAGAADCYGGHQPYV